MNKTADQNKPEPWQDLSLEDREGEIWKNIPEYNGDYQVSNLGRIKSMKYRSSNRTAILRQKQKDNGYIQIILCSNGKPKHLHTHRVVAQVFTPTDDVKLQIDHIDTNRTNNNINNLQWCTHKENMNNPISREKNSKSNKGRIALNKKRTYMIDSSTGDILNVFHSATEAAKILNICHSCITDVCRGERKTAGGYKFEFLTKLIN